MSSTHLVTFMKTVGQPKGLGAATWSPCIPNLQKHFVKCNCGYLPREEKHAGFYKGTVQCANVSTLPIYESYLVVNPK